MRLHLLFKKYRNWGETPAHEKQALTLESTPSAIRPPSTKPKPLFCWNLCVLYLLTYDGVRDAPVAEVLAMATKRQALERARLLHPHPDKVRSPLCCEKRLIQGLQLADTNPKRCHSLVKPLNQIDVPSRRDEFDKRLATE